MKLEEDKHFKFVDFKDSDITGIGILVGDYTGVLYHYTGARVNQQSGMPKLEFGYTIVHAGEHDIDSLQSDDKFHTMMGDILTELIINNRYNEQIRTNDSEEFDL
jgi:hypothetical protein